MSLQLYYHPFSRASNVVWMLEELEVPYDLRFVDLASGEQKRAPVIELNPMGKLPILVDNGTTITESAAIGLYLADRYSPGVLAPDLNDPARGEYLRWILFCPSVIEPGLIAKGAGWEFREGQVGWGNYEALLKAMRLAVTPGPHILGDRFSMADIVLGATLRFMLRFKMAPEDSVFVKYVEHLQQRPAWQRADAVQAQSIEEHGLNR